MVIGKHISPSDLKASAFNKNLGTAQIFISNPRSYQKATPKYLDECAAFLQSGKSFYVHAPYLVNIVSSKESVRQLSIECLQNQLQVAAQLGATAVVVHAGQGGKGGTVDETINNWVTGLGFDLPIPLLLENTAGGFCAPGKNLQSLAELILLLRNKHENIGVCLDTCHAHAAGQNAADIDNLGHLLGGIDLFHVNDSKDAFASNRDRHENLGSGQLDLISLQNTLQKWASNKTPLITETPLPPSAQENDMNWLYLNR